MPKLRLDKILSDAGVATRSEVKLMLKLGRITVNGAIVRDGSEKFESEALEIAIDGARINSAKNRYFLLHKPLGVITASSDREQKTVLDLFPQEIKRLGVFAVGRLDKDSSGLLIITNDGDYSHRVISPKKHVNKVYLAEVDADLEDADIARFKAGITLADGTNCLPATLEIYDKRHCRVTICEGKYHQVRRMLAACGKHVVTLHRESIGKLKLDETLAAGEFLELSAEHAALVFEN